ncbi:hypothetical protein Y032_0117g638 [Ancylostoma ceylanicum]|uniref:Uncharacterized protein n=1 Tax=Ancylostoma ceylanicum TaxID=53326 RepID=A0A016TC06_9BILA|nr:hypothetical protein Y032_0117g638 [Ancylostoma ceylanicum]
MRSYAYTVIDVHSHRFIEDDSCMFAVIVDDNSIPVMHAPLLKVRNFERDLWFPSIGENHPDKPSELPRGLPIFGTSAELGLLLELDFRNFRGNMTSLINFFGNSGNVPSGDAEKMLVSKLPRSFAISGTSAELRDKYDHRRHYRTE